MKTLGIKKFEDIVFEEKRFYLTVAEKKFYYYKRCNAMLDNKVNIYINYLNFKIIYNFFSNTKNEKLKVLDLGCGIGDKSVILKKIFPSFDVYGIETKNYDDPDHKKHKPYLFFEKLYDKISKRYNVNFGFYDGLNLNFKDRFFDIIFLYAIIEHISPDKRLNFINNVEKKLKNGGYFVITRCPRHWGIIEFLSRKP